MRAESTQRQPAWALENEVTALSEQVDTLTDDYRRVFALAAELREDLIFMHAVAHQGRNCTTERCRIDTVLWRSDVQRLV